LNYSFEWFSQILCARDFITATLSPQAKSLESVTLDAIRRNKQSGSRF